MYGPAPSGVKDGLGQQCTAEFPSSRFAAQTKEERKTKGSDEKEAIDNELLGNALFREWCPSQLQRGRAAGFMMVKYYLLVLITTKCSDIKSQRIQEI